MTRRCERISWEDFTKSGRLPRHEHCVIKDCLDIQSPDDAVFIDTPMHGDLGRGPWVMFTVGADGSVRHEIHGEYYRLIRAVTLKKVQVPQWQVDAEVEL